MPIFLLFLQHIFRFVKLQMINSDRNRIFKQILWDYNISVQDIELVLNGQKEFAGHYNREKLFIKIIESYSWFTVIRLFSPGEILTLLSPDTINKLRSPSLRKKYEFVQKRLQQIIPASE